jgi:hypothetical protein
MKRSTLIFLMATVVLSVGTASAAHIGLDLETALVEIFQNTDASPCVIGGKNCSGFLSYTVEGGGGAGTLSDGILSPVYDVATIFSIAGNNFIIGIDVPPKYQPTITGRTRWANSLGVL